MKGHGLLGRDGSEGGVTSDLGKEEEGEVEVVVRSLHR